MDLEGGHLPTPLDIPNIALHISSGFGVVHAAHAGQDGCLPPPLSGHNDFAAHKFCSSPNSTLDMGYIIIYSSVLGQEGQMV